LVYFRAQLAFLFHEEKENYDSLVNLNSNYLENLFENIYEGLKQGHSFLTLVIYLFEVMIYRNPSKTIALILKYNFLFLFIENL